MSEPQLPADSYEGARNLLSALMCGDMDTLQRQLERTADLPATPGLPWMEYERRELLAGITQRMRAAISRTPAHFFGCDVEVSVQLLEHMIGKQRLSIN